MGFESGILSWKRFIKPDGFLVVSEITWTTEKRPSEIEVHWKREYPEIGTASANLSALEKAGYTPVAYFTLPENCWNDNYYLPIHEGLKDFLKRNRQSHDAKAIVDNETLEWELFRKYKSFFNYGFYIAKNAG
jgi:hypothetical protein